MNDEDRKKLVFLDQLVKQGKTASDEEVRWLIDSLKGMLSRPDEFDFPEFAALYAPSEHKAYALLRVGMPNWTKDFEIPENCLSSNATIFEQYPDCDPYSAFLVVRPWIRVLEGSIETLRRCTLSLDCEGTVLMNKSPVDFYLIGQDGAGFHRWMDQVRALQHSILSAFAMVEGKREADPDKLLGIFVGRNTPVRLKLHGPKSESPASIKLRVGLTAMLYTTKGPGGGADLSMPRKISEIKT
jgi:hypothetical protein